MTRLPRDHLLPLTDRERRAVTVVIEWAVAPSPPLPPVDRTDAVTAFAIALERGPRAQRWLLRAVLGALSLPHLIQSSREGGGRDVPVVVLRWLERGPGAMAVELLAGLAQLAYYGDAGVAGVLGYHPPRIDPGRR